MRERLDPKTSAAIMAERRRVMRAEHRKTVKQCDGSGNAPYSTSGDKGECAACGDSFALRKDGMVRAHDERPGIEPDWRAREAARRLNRLYRWFVASRCKADDELEFYGMC